MLRGQEEEHPEGLVQLATESVHHGACKEESAAEEQVHPLPVAFRCRANAARVARVFDGSSQTTLAHRVTVTDRMQVFFNGLVSARDYKA